MKLYRVIEFIILFFALFLTSCSSVDRKQVTDARDPFENSNRNIYAFNNSLDTLILEPIALGYNSVIPKYAKTAISNHVSWASLPNTALNSGLQNKWENAAISSLHFSINALTFGTMNLVDGDKPAVRQDFGQTLSGFGVPQGPYIVLPITGGKTSRHAFAEIFNLILNPYSVFQKNEQITNVFSFQPVLSSISWRANNFDFINDIKYNSLDAYVRARSAYYQNRFGNMQENNDVPSEADSLFENLNIEG